MIALHQLDKPSRGVHAAFLCEGQGIIGEGRGVLAGALEDGEVHGAYMAGDQPPAQEQQGGIGHTERKQYPSARHKNHSDTLNSLNVRTITAECGRVKDFVTSGYLD
jgi:hypothetical protein